MAAIKDGPSSPHFRPVSFTGNAVLAELASDKLAIESFGMSEEMTAALSQAPVGSGVSWGIPFEIGRAVILAREPVSIQVSPVRARWLVFLHTSDVRPLKPGPGGIISPMRGAGQLAEHAGDYVICYADGSEARAAIRRRFQVGAFQRGWGENCFECVAAHKPYPARSALE